MNYFLSNPVISFVVLNSVMKTVEHLTIICYKAYILQSYFCTYLNE